MNNFERNHPCAGKDCLDCETCIFDVDLFADHVAPNENLKQESKNKNLNKMNSIRTCNGCVNLIRSYEQCPEGHFDAACKVVTFEAFNVKRPRKIDFNLSLNQDICSPPWCPLISSQNQLCLPSTPSSARPKPQETGPRQTETTSGVVVNSYSDKREKMKALRKHVNWENIEEGKLYVIPKIFSQSRKIVKVITKTEMSCICHEISEYTGAEYTYNCTFYPSDLDAVFITELRNF